MFSKKDFRARVNFCGRTGLPYVFVLPPALLRW